MTQVADVFKKNYEEYIERIKEIDLASVSERLGLKKDGDKYLLRFFDRNYIVSGKGITDESGNDPDYAACVILAKYLILCPDNAPHFNDWAAFKDFKKTSHFTNVNYFASDTERALAVNFTGKLDDLARACDALGGKPSDVEFSYDLARQFQALPKMSLLLLFNDQEGRFPAFGTVLFQKHGEYYLDPESLAVTSAYLVRRLKTLAFDPSA
ncbi:MAG: DUF3786 domain-containing protein [Desulfatibacillum sp.]|nr:DUF3786 domain-containing protein [Desulfatibacillum sp.]